MKRNPLFRRFQQFLTWTIILYFLVFSNRGSPFITRCYKLHQNIYVLTEDFTDEQLDDINYALLSWVEKTHGDYSYTLTSPNQADVIIRNLSPHNKQFIQLEKQLGKETPGDPHYIGFYIGGKHPTIYILSARITSEDSYAATVEHELGHSMGLEHSSDETSLMYWNQTSDNLEISKEDIAAYCLRHRCTH